MVRPWKAGNYPNIGNWSVFVFFGWRFVSGMIMGWEGREPFLSDAIGFWEIIKLPLSYQVLVSIAKVNNTKDLLDRQTCQGILCVST